MPTLTRAIVIPEVEHVPNRIYVQDGATVRVYAIPDHASHRYLGYVAEVMRTEPVLVLDCRTEAQAQWLMNDLYYGEYTGA